MLRVRGHTPTPHPSVVSTFGLKVESIKELGVRQIININIFLQFKATLKYQG
jgi:hypothetical protein